MKYKVLIPEDISEAGKKYLLEHGCEIKILDNSSVESICSHVADYDAILARNALISKKVIECGNKLKVIARHGVGYDNVDLKAATEHHVQVCYTPMSNSNSVAEYTIAMILACAKKIVSMDQKTRNGEWKVRNEEPTIEVAGKTLGVIGFGRIGSLVAKKAALGLDMKVLIYRRQNHTDRLPDYVEECSDIDEIFKTADFVSIHTALNESTKNLVNMDRINYMKNTAFLINTSRGPVVDENALINALKDKKIAGAGLDVFMEEPPCKDNELFKLNNVIVTPHNAALTKEAMDRMGLDAARSIIEVLHGDSVTWPVNQCIYN